MEQQEGCAWAGAYENHYDKIWFIGETWLQIVLLLTELVSILAKLMLHL